MIRFYTSGKRTFEKRSEYNVGFKGVKKLLENPIIIKELKIEIINIDTMKAEEIRDLYNNEVIIWAQRVKKVTRVVFGRRGVKFGNIVPAILVYNDEGTVLVEVYPRVEQNGKKITIADYFESLPLKDIEAKAKEGVEKKSTEDKRLKNQKEKKQRK